VATVATMAEGGGGGGTGEAEGGGGTGEKTLSACHCEVQPSQSAPRYR